MVDTKRDETVVAECSSDGLPTNETTSETRSLGHSPKSPRWRKILSFFWDSFDGDLRDRRYVQKLDSYLLWVRSRTWKTRQLILTSLDKVHISV